MIPNKIQQRVLDVSEEQPVCAKDNGVETHKLICQVLEDAGFQDRMADLMMYGEYYD